MVMNMASVLSQLYFYLEEPAFKTLERIMCPGSKPQSCPHRGVAGRADRLTVQRKSGFDHDLCRAGSDGPQRSGMG